MDEKKITLSEYWRQMKTIAKDAKRSAMGVPKADRFDKATEFAEQTVDSHEWVIYTWANPYVLIYSAHEDKIFDDYGPQLFESYAEGMMKLAAYAMRADVMHVLDGLMPPQ